MFLIIKVKSQCSFTGMRSLPNEQLISYQNYSSKPVEIVNSKYIMFHNAWGPSTIVSKANNQIVKFDLWFDVNLLHAFYDTVNARYIFIGSEHENKGIIGLFDSNFNPIKTRKYENFQFNSANHFKNNIIIGSEGKLIEINQTTLNVKNSITTGKGSIWAIACTRNSILCGGDNGEFVLINNKNIIPLLYMEKTDNIVGIETYANNFIIFASKSILLVNGKAELISRLPLEEKYCSYFFYCPDSSRIVIGLNNGILKFYETATFKYLFELKIPGLNYTNEIEIASEKLNNNIQESGQVIGYMTRMSSSDSSSVATRPYYYPLTGFEITSGDSVAYCDIQGNFGLLDTNCHLILQNNYDGVMAKGLVASSLRNVFIWYADGSEFMYYNELGHLSQTSIFGNYVRNIAISYEGDMIYYTKYLDTTMNMANTIYRKLIYPIRENKYTFKYTDTRTLQVTNPISKFANGKGGILGFLFENNEFALYDFLTSKRLFYAQNIQDYALLNKKWILLTTESDLIKVKSKNRAKKLGNLVEDFTNLSISFNGKYLCAYDSNRATLLEIKNLQVIKSFDCPTEQHFKYIKILNSGSVVYFTELNTIDLNNVPIPASTEQTPSISAEIERLNSPYISSMVYEPNTNKLYVQFKDGQFMVYQIII